MCVPHLEGCLFLILHNKGTKRKSPGADIKKPPETPHDPRDPLRKSSVIGWDRSGPLNQGKILPASLLRYHTSIGSASKTRKRGTKQVQSPSPGKDFEADDGAMDMDDDNITDEPAHAAAKAGGKCQRACYNVHENFSFPFCSGLSIPFRETGTQYGLLRFGSQHEQHRNRPT